MNDLHVRLGMEDVIRSVEKMRQRYDRVLVMRAESKVDRQPWTTDDEFEMLCKINLELRKDNDRLRQKLREELTFIGMGTHVNKIEGIALKSEYLEKLKEV